MKSLTGMLGITAYKIPKVDIEPPPPLSLPDVTLVAIDTVAHDLTQLALRECVSRVHFGDVLIYSDKPLGELKGRWIKTRPLRSWAEVNEVWWHWLPFDIDTSHYLMVQWDSWVINPEAWDPLWLQWDYIGAVWPWHPTSRVGNGGFSLRSRRLAAHVAEHPERYPIHHPEDDTLCRRYRMMLEADGFRWAPDAEAERFSFERGNGSVYRAGGPIGALPFGFHGAFNFCELLSLEGLEQRIAAATDYAKGKAEWREMLDRRRAMYFPNAPLRRSPCGECHLRPGEICDICGAVAPCCDSATP